MQYASRRLSSFVTQEEGASLVEYGLLAGLIALVCVVAVTAVGQALKTPFEDAASELGP